MRLCPALPCLLALGCGGPAKPPDPPAAPLPICSSFMPPPAVPFASGGPDQAACTEGGPVATQAAADIVPMGYVALGKAIRFDGALGPRGADFVIPCDLGRGPKEAPAVRIVVVEQRGNGAVVMPPVSNLVYEGGHKRLHFHNDEAATYQAAIPATAGTPSSRRYTYRALAGVSMGGIGASMNFWRHPDRYDALSVMGADPGPDLTYTLALMQDWFFAGFCTAEDEKANKGKVGQLCPPRRKPLTDQYELSMDFEHLLYQKGEGVGLTLRRKLYIKAFRDLSRAFGNGAYATAPGASTFLPPGVPPSTLALPNAEACARPTVLKGFFDRKYNPEGKLPAITFCDGVDAEQPGFFPTDPKVVQTNPTQILLAVDVNGDGRRNSGEPVILQGGEPFRDVGPDGKASAEEPGYDALKNPDPAKDDFHWLHNPGGSENNWRWDQGEPYEDTGVDGVLGKGCEVGKGAECYDFGEKNGKFDYNPNTANWRAHDPRTLLEQLPAAALSRVDVYYDAGIRDFLNAHVSTNSLVAALHHRGEPVRVWDTFPALVGAAPQQDERFLITEVDFAGFGRRAYVRYGNPATPPHIVEATGDGRHVGTVLQATHRAQMLFYFIDHVWPDADRAVPQDPSAPDPIKAEFTAKNGRKTPYTVILPPGYMSPEYANRRYPIVYVMHGYGMDANDLGAIGVVSTSAMLNPRHPLQKMIVVAVDGRCRPGGEIESGPLPLTGDLCEEGTFYTNHPDGAVKGEDHLLELQQIIDATYRVKAPEERMVTQ